MILAELVSTSRSMLDMRCGSGRLEVSLCAGRSVVTRCRAYSPLKLLTPRTSSHASWVLCSTYGGGLVAGDSVELEAAVGPGATCFLGTQSSEKIYPREGTHGCTRLLDLKIAEGGLAVVAPDPTICYADSQLTQRQRIEMDPTAGLVLIDSLTSGRRAGREMGNAPLSRIHGYFRRQ